MNLYLLVVALQLPLQPSGLKPEPIELHRQLVSASQHAVCQAEADKLAEQHRKQRAEELQRFKAAVIGGCTQVPAASTGEQA